MRAVRFHDHGGPDVLRVDDAAAPDPGHGEVVVDVEAVGVNPVDTYFREGAYPVPHLPFVPGSDLAGTVAAVGAGVERFETGDRVYGTGLGNGTHGTYAESVAAPVDLLAPLPESVSFEAGAALALVGVTAWEAFVRHAGLEPAERALVHGGSGGVGHVAVQLARTMGARVTATASEAYRDRLRGLGADAVVDYRADDLADRVRAAGAPDAVLDTRMDEYLQFDAEVAADGARVICVGNAGEEAGFSAVGTPKNKGIRYQFMTMYDAPDTAGVLERLATLCAEGAVEPVVERTYGFDEAGAAQRDVIEESFLGKLVLVP